MDLAEQHNVSGYPTMVVYRKGKVSEYKGPREGPGTNTFSIIDCDKFDVKQGGMEFNQF